jgi:flagellar motor switch protein FliN/FliY
MADEKPPEAAAGTTTGPTLDPARDIPPPTTTADSGITDAEAQAASLENFSIEELLSQASFEDPGTLSGGAGGQGAAHATGGAAVSAAAAAAITGAEFKLPSFQQAMHDAQASSIDLLRDVELNVKIELGRSRMLVEDVLKLAEGSVVELDKLAGDPVDVFVNDRLVARGEVLVLNDNFCVRVNEIVAGAKEEAM